MTVSRLEIERLKLKLAKARREQFGQSSERGRLLVEQLSWPLRIWKRPRPSRKARLIAAPKPPSGVRKSAAASTSAAVRLVERIVEPAPCACGKCGSERLQAGEVVSTLECEPQLGDHRARPRSSRARTARRSTRHRRPHIRSRVVCRTEPAGDGAYGQQFLLHQPLNRRKPMPAKGSRSIDPGGSGRRLRGARLVWARRSGPGRGTHPRR